MTEQTVLKKDKGHPYIQSRIEDLQNYFEDIVFAYQTRKTEVNHIMGKIQKKVEEVYEKGEDRTVKDIGKLQEEVSKKIRLSNGDISQTKTLLTQFISREWLYFNEILQCESQDQHELLELINQTTEKRMSQLKGLVLKEKHQSTQGPSIVKLRNLLRQKCDFLQKQLAGLRQNTVKYKKQVTRQVKAMLQILQQVQQQRQDRQAKEETVLGLIDQMIP